MLCEPTFLLIGLRDSVELRSRIRPSCGRVGLACEACKDLA